MPRQDIIAEMTRSNQLCKSGFSLLELILVMFMLSLLAVLTVPLFKAPSQTAPRTDDGGRQLATFIESLKQQAMTQHTAFFLHLDLVAGRVWATPQTDAKENPHKKTDLDTQTKPEFLLEGLPLSDVSFSGLSHGLPEDTIIEISRQGITDMALIHMSTPDGEMTLKLHPFLYQVELLEGHYSFNDCI